MKRLFKFLMLMLTLSACLNTHAEPVNWRFQIGGMPNILRTPIEHKDIELLPFSFMGGIEIQVPFKNNWFVETGASFRYGPVTFTMTEVARGEYGVSIWRLNNLPLKDFDKNGNYIGGDDLPWTTVRSHHSNFVDIPIRAGWKFVLNEENEFQFAIGPCLSIYCGRLDWFTREKVKNFNRFSVGLSPSVVYKHRALSLGLYYNNPCIYNGSKNRETNTLMFTIGVNFYGRKINVDKLLAGLEAANGVLSVANNTLTSYYGNSHGTENLSSSTYSQLSDIPSTDGRNYQEQYDKWAQRAKSIYESLTLLGSKYRKDDGDRSGTAGGPDKISTGNYQSMKRSLRDAQKQMEKIRSDARKAGVTIQKSEWETANVNY